jgi:hypothetical protein
MIKRKGSEKNVSHLYVSNRPQCIVGKEEHYTYEHISFYYFLMWYTFDRKDNLKVKQKEKKKIHNFVYTIEKM